MPPSLPLSLTTALTLYPATNNMTIDKVYKTLTDILKKAGADSPAFDAISLMEAVLGTKRSDLTLFPEKEVSHTDSEKLLALAKRRALGEPLQYIIGYWEFFGRRFYVGEGVLIPRDDTEVVLSCTFEFLDSLKKDRPIKILDLCSGSGILAVSLKCRYPQAQVTAVEISPLALPYLRRNARENNADINIIHADIFECADEFSDEEFDLIISNPPYVTDEDMENLQKEVRFEPSLALAGGKDGCDFYRKIIPLYAKKLRNGGMLAFEYDGSQAHVIEALMIRADFCNIRIFDDIGGVHRAINGTLHKV